MLHGLRHSTSTMRLDRDGALPRTLMVGPDRAANLLELVILHLDDGTDVLIHAMRLRRWPLYPLPHD